MYTLHSSTKPIHTNVNLGKKKQRKSWPLSSAIICICIPLHNKQSTIQLLNIQYSNKIKY